MGYGQPARPQGDSRPLSMTTRIEASQRVQSAAIPQVDLSAAILAALQAVRQSPNSGNPVGEQATALAGAFRELGLQSNGWEHRMLYNYKQLLNGADPNALANFKANLAQGSGVMSRAGMNKALAMANQAVASVQKQQATQAARTAAANARANDGKTDLGEAQACMDMLTSKRFNITERAASNIVATLRDAGFKPNAQQNALAMVRKYQQLVAPEGYGTRGLGELQKDVAELKKMVTTAGQQGTISLGQQRGLLKQIAGWEKNPAYNNKSPEQVAEIKKQAEVQRGASVNSPEMAPYRQTLEDMKFLRDDLASRNGSMWGSGPVWKYSAENLIQRIPEFEKLIESGDVSKVKAYEENNLRTKPRGMTLRGWAEEIRATDARTQKVFAAGHAILESFGPVPYVASKLLSNVMKGQRENLPMKTVAYNTMVDIVSYAAGRGYTGKVGGMVNEAMLDFARSAAADIAKDPTPAGIGKALINGWKEAVLGVAGKGLKELSPEQRAELAQKLFEVGSKVLDESVVKPVIDEAFKER